MNPWRRLARRISRREMLLGMAGVGGGAIATHLVKDCKIPLRDISRVAFVKTTDRETGVRDALRILSPYPLQGKRILLKPNLNSADPPPASTHPDTLRALAEWLLDEGASQVIIGDRSGIGETRDVMETTGVLALAQDLGLEVAPFDELGGPDWTQVQPENSHWSGGFAVPSLLSTVDAVVQTCNLKTHGFGGHFTMSLKNSVGLVARTVPGQPHDYMSELHNSPHQRKMIAEINAAYSPEIIVLDGVQAFTTGGPSHGTEVTAEVIMAATDRVALDAVAVAVLRYWGTTPEVSEGPVFEQEQIARAVELGLGAASSDEIKIAARDQPSEEYAAEVRAILNGG